jgi:putative acetyltransferase
MTKEIPANISVRKISKEDNASLAEMIRAVFDEYEAPKTGSVYSDPTTDDLFSLFQKNGSVLWTALADGKAAGCCGVYPTAGLPEHCAELAKFYLRPAVRGQGLGRYLMEKTLQSAGELGYKFLYLESFPQFATAVSLYEKFGFKKLKHPLGETNHFACTIWMIKELA